MADRKKSAFYCREDILNDFNNFWPFSMSRFIENCLRMALEDKDFFSSVYFHSFPVFQESTDGSTEE